jgi:hypothetical protein
MPEQELDDPDVAPALQQVSGERVAQRLNTLLIARLR